MKKLKFLNKKVMCIITTLVLGLGVVYCAVNRIPFDDNPDTVQTAGIPSKDLVIVLDAGHGGMDGGCSSADGIPEKGINLNILLNLRDMLVTSGYTVEVTRDTDISIHDKGIEGIANQKSSDMDNRLALFNKYPNAVCISIHQNQFTDAKYSGAQIFYSDTNSENQRFAESIQKKFVGFIQPDNTRETKLCGKELFLCYFSKNPTIMAECGFLSNPDEASKLKTEEYQKQVAFTIYAGLLEFLSSKK